MSKQTIKALAYWTTTILGPTSFLIGGVLGLGQSDEVISSLNHLGYPAYFGTILGAWKLLGALALTVPGLPRLKEWAYAGFVFDLTAAAFSHAMVGDGAAAVAGPLVFLALVLASWGLRPASRKLAAAAPAPAVNASARGTAPIVAAPVGA
jgi:hypothetical protein